MFYLTSNVTWSTCFLFWLIICLNRLNVDFLYISHILDTFQGFTGTKCRENIRHRSDIDIICKNSLNCGEYELVGVTGRDFVLT